MTEGHRNMEEVLSEQNENFRKALRLLLEKGELITKDTMNEKLNEQRREFDLEFDRKLQNLKKDTEDKNRANYKLIDKHNISNFLNQHEDYELIVNTTVSKIGDKFLVKLKRRYSHYEQEK